MVKIIKQTTSMQTRDRVRLDADIYRPETEEKLPILLMRQPYGREIASTVVYAHPRWYAAQGYIVVIQDVRGRGTSAGNFDLFTHEVADGLDTINWVSSLPHSTGKVGMYGFSYQGMTQLYTAAHQPACLKAIAPAMVAYDLYSDWAYENGAFCLWANLAWAIQLAGETARLKGDEAAYLKLKAASSNLPLNGSIAANPELMQELAPDSFYHQWLHHPDTGAEYWQKRSPKYLLDKVDLPMLHVGGWFDPYLRGTMSLYQAMVAQCNQPQHLLVGAWGHLPWGSKLAEVDYGVEAQNPIDEIQIRWFDHWLKGIDTGLLAESTISLFEMGSNSWREFDSLPRKQIIFYLASDGLASIREDSGMLWQYEELVDPSPQELIETDLSEIVSEFDHNIDILVHDPWRPVPALGGHAIYPSGSFERSLFDSRSDILTYTSASLESDLHLTGAVTLEIYCATENPSFDLCTVLSTVNPDGAVFNFTQGYIRVVALDSNPNLIKIPLQPTCICIKAGDSLRLSLSGACFPAYPVNSGDGKLPHESHQIDNSIITIEVHSGGDYTSKLVINN
ncbi:MAG: CocE/NonD family hydrolase [Pleurocapsa sp. SU_5_0]|nr:CocE/NonD family hydrolase [Pleurocapsa sp. SU_5_0]NJO96239.1 CocE/NonD family hydrolase [Pleurocapsa sp. CRU_1_2]